MLREVISALFAIALTSCAFAPAARSPSKGASAGITAAAAVAAAGVYRATSGGCWAACANGQRCDRGSGMCVDLPCREGCPVGSPCTRVAGVERCESSRDAPGVPRVAPDPELAASVFTAPTPPAYVPDACGRDCLPSERCITDAGRPRCEIDDEPQN